MYRDSDISRIGWTISMFVFLYWTGDIDKISESLLSTIVHCLVLANYLLLFEIDEKIRFVVTSLRFVGQLNSCRYHIRYGSIGH